MHLQHFCDQTCRSETRFYIPTSSVCFIRQLPPPPLALKTKLLCFYVLEDENLGFVDNLLFPLFFAVSTSLSPAGADRTESETVEPNRNQTFQRIASSSHLLTKL